MSDIVIQSIWQFLSLSWWLWAFFILMFFAESAWLYWRNEAFKHSIEFRMMMMELVMPREILRSPRAMEQVLMVINSLRNFPGDVRERWWDGEITRTFTMEMVSFGGQIRFFIRFHFRHRPLVEAAFHSYYPDVELREVDDYVDQFPANVHEMKEQGYDMWGTEMLLAREGAYPIRTYLDFESPDENKEYDPISVFIEVLAKAKKEEIVAVQLVIVPKDPKWKDAPKIKKLVEDLRSRSEGEKKQPGASTATKFPGGPLPHFEVTKGDDVKMPLMSFMRTPGETDVLKAVENNLAKPAFDVAVRILYFSPKAIFYDSYARRGVAGSFNQYAAMDLNYFVQNYTVGTRTRIWSKPYVFPKKRGAYRMDCLINDYRNREIPPYTWIGRIITSHLFRWNFSSRTFTLNAQCLATIYHPPTAQVVTAPHMTRVESRKAGLPGGMAVYGEEEDIERYQ